MNDTTENTEQRLPQQVECHSTKDPAIRVFIAAAMFLGFGIWCFVDMNKYDPPEAWNMQHINDAAKYAMNHYGGFVLVPVGLVLAIGGVRFLRRKLVADGAGIGYAGKDKTAWDAVAELDAKELKSKGIVYLRLGQDKSLTLDSWKLTNFRELLKFIETKIPQDRQKA
ncbi:MAG: hypothetical protein DRP83_00875 [Planctomycetota bacterium]|nr:MAG: hypothetical protein DRP83_00875 [Planctomycetota bacterium]